MFNGMEPIILFSLPSSSLYSHYREMLDQINTYFNIKPDIDLAVMTPEQTLAELSSAMLTRLARVMQEQRPDVVVVQVSAHFECIYEQSPLFPNGDVCCMGHSVSMHKP